MTGVRHEVSEDEDLKLIEEQSVKNRVAYCMTTMGEIGANLARFKIFNKLYQSEKYKTLLQLA